MRNVTQEGKLYEVNRRLGNPYSKNQQQTTRIVFDTENVASGTTGVEFFVNFGGKNRNQTNLTEGKLSSQDSMVIKEIDFIAPANPLLGLADFSLIVGSQEVVKNMPLHFSPVAGLDVSPLSKGSSSSWAFRMVTDIVIPPQVSFKVRVRMQAGSFADASNLGCALKGFGTLFNPENSL